MSPRERLFALEHFGIKLGLDNITTLVEAFGRPDRAYPNIHVAGTNGKGSVTAMVERGLRAAGHTTGRYTSPHLAHVEERIAVNGLPVDGRMFDDVTSSVLQSIDGLRARGRLPSSPTFFETTTAIAFEIFRRRQVTVGVIEVGLGGRFDATNVIGPVLTAITSIAFDHQRHLGQTLAEIAFEKAGIIKPGVPVVIGPMPREARDVIEDGARAMDAPLVAAEPAHGGGTPLSLSLPGVHQRNNAAVAAEVLRLAGETGLGVLRGHIVSALTDVEWPARLEWLRLPSGGDVLIDAAHNPDGAHALADYVLATVEPLPIVLGVMKDKDVDAMIRALSPAVSRFVATQPVSARALDAEALADRLRILAPEAPVDCRVDPVTALDLAMSHAPRTMLAGSIFLIGPLRDLLMARGAVPVRYPSKTAPFFLAS